jgi:type VI secretion system protein ImpH
MGNSTLGEDLHAGQMVMDRSGKFRITFGPVGIKPFLSFLPHERNFAALDQIVRLFVTDQLEYEVEVILKREEIPNLMLSDDSHGAYLGQTTWLGRPKEDARVVFQEPRRDRWNHLDEINEGRAAFLAA